MLASMDAKPTVYIPDVPMPLLLEASHSMYGDTEVFSWPRQLSDQERDVVRRGLAKKFGVRLTE